MILYRGVGTVFIVSGIISIMVFFLLINFAYSNSSPSVLFTELREIKWNAIFTRMKGIVLVKLIAVANR